MLCVDWERNQPAENRPLGYMMPAVQGICCLTNEGICAFTCAVKTPLHLLTHTTYEPKHCKHEYILLGVKQTLTLCKPVMCSSHYAT